jgi:hypothetical protein
MKGHVSKDHVHLLVSIPYPSFSRHLSHAAFKFPWEWMNNATCGMLASG